MSKLRYKLKNLLIEADNPERIKIEKRFERFLNKVVKGHKPKNILNFWKQYEAVKKANYDEGAKTGKEKPEEKEEPKEEKELTIADRAKANKERREKYQKRKSMEKKEKVDESKFNTYMRRHLLKENIETLLSPEDLEYYRAHRDEIEDILHAEWRSSKLSAKDAVEKHKENKLQQAKRGGGKETSLRAIAALGNNPLKELHDPRMDDPRYGSSPRKFAELRDRLGDSILLDHIALMDVNDLEDLIDKLGEV